MDEIREPSNPEAQEISDMEQRFASDFQGEKKAAQDWPESWQESESPEPEEKFSLRHLGQELETGREETVELAQKGLDYDRVRSQRDYMRGRIKELEGLLGDFSAAAGLSPNDFLRQHKAENLMKKAEEAGGSLSFEEALSMAEVEDFDPERAEKRRRQESILNFSRNFPQVRAEDIPESVWKEFSSGGDLSPLYAMEENRSLRARVQALEQEAKNRSRSTLSRLSAGNSADEGLEELWNNGD